MRKKIDGLFYAVKKIRLNPADHAANAKLLREVTTLARLHHENVVRYYNAWIEEVETKEDGSSGAKRVVQDDATDWMTQSVCASAKESKTRGG